MQATTSHPTGWRQLLTNHARQHPATALGLGAGLIALVAGLALSAELLRGDWPNGARLALLGGGAGFVATAIGALPALLLRQLPQRVEDTMLGFVAGMMLAATAFSLILPGLDAGAELTGSKPLGAGLVVAGMLLGGLLMLGLDEFTPHEHDKTGPCGPGHERCGRAWLFVFAIALHNLPEGMAIGVSFAQGDLAVGLPLTTAIAVQDIPEGLAVALALRAAGFSSAVSVLTAIGSGLLEPVGAALGLAVASGAPFAYPASLGFAAGAMLFVVSHEVIPETHRNGHQRAATLGLLGGFALMMVLDTTLG